MLFLGGEVKCLVCGLDRDECQDCISHMAREATAAVGDG